MTFFLVEFAIELQGDDEKLTDMKESLYGYTSYAVVDMRN